MPEVLGHCRSRASIRRKRYVIRIGSLPIDILAKPKARDWQAMFYW
jgi:hypothetical protein